MGGMLNWLAAIPVTVDLYTDLYIDFYTDLWIELDTPLGVSTTVVFLLLCGITAAAALFWWWRLAAVDRWPRLLLAGLRAITLSLIFLLLLDPVLVGRRIVQSKDFVLLLFDDSLSMQVRFEEQEPLDGAPGQTRGQRLLKAYTASDVVTQLQHSHQITLFRFGDHLERLRHLDDLTFAQRATDLHGALEAALRKMSGVNVAAVVIFSDGIQQTLTPPPTTAPLQVPVFAIGTGVNKPQPSLELAGLSVNRTHFDRQPVAVTAQIRTTGLVGETAVLEILDHGDTDTPRQIASMDLILGPQTAPQNLRLEFIPQKKGWRSYRARVRLTKKNTATDLVDADNFRDFIVDNRPKTYRILYLGGQPSWEHKFVRRALDADPHLALSSLIRVSGAEAKFVFQGQAHSLVNPLFSGLTDQLPDAPRYDEAVFLRLGANAADLPTGYPLEARRLFPFHLVIWSDIEHAFFSAAQLELTRNFVTRRGGSFLITGGPRSLNAGRYAHTSIEAMLPAVLGNTNANAASSSLPAKPRPTIEGLLSGIWTLDADPQRNAAHWMDLPALYDTNYLAATRAGATVLARFTGAAGMEGQPLFAWQRYGEGTTAILATGGTWTWRMMTDAANQQHTRFWRQLARTLVKNAPTPIILSEGATNLHVGDQNKLAFLVRDSLYVHRQGLVTQLHLTAPDGGQRPLAVEESLRQNGIYTAAFIPEQAGMHRLKLTVHEEGVGPIGSLKTALMVHPDNRELQHPHYDPAFLKDLATRSGGAFFSLDQLDQVVERIPQSTTQIASLDRFSLWHLPLFYGLLVALLAYEWFLRRRQGQP